MPEQSEGIGPLEFRINGEQMGHDIDAYLGLVAPTDLKQVASPDELTDEIAELRGHWGLYDVLDAQEYDGKVSGIGLGRWFSRDQLILALRRLKDQYPTEFEITVRSNDGSQRSEQMANPAIGFIQSCLDQLP